jgi:hypothetical protein
VPNLASPERMTPAQPHTSSVVLESTGTCLTSTAGLHGAQKHTSICAPSRAAVFGRPKL